MSEPCFYAIAEQRAIAFGRRTQAVLADRDIAAWTKLFEKLSVLRRRPYLAHNGTFDLDVEPLTRFDWYLRPDRTYEVLAPNVTPPVDYEPLQWLLTNALLLACDYKLFVRWSKFHFGWTITIADEKMVQPGTEQAEFDLIVHTFFEHPGGLPQELRFLASASYLHAYATAERTREIVEVEDGAGLLARLARHYGSSTEPITRSFGEEIGKLHHFLRIAALERNAVFMCYHAV